MIETKSAPKPGEGTLLWLIKIFTGVLIIVLLLVHFLVNHFVAEGALLTYQDVVAYYANPLIVAMEITFLITVVSHGLVGLRSVILDLNPARGTMRVVDGLFWIVGIVSIAYGIWLALVVASQAA